MGPEVFMIRMNCQFRSSSREIKTREYITSTVRIFRFTSDKEDKPGNVTIHEKLLQNRRWKKKAGSHLPSAIDLKKVKRVKIFVILLPFVRRFFFLPLYEQNKDRNYQTIDCERLHHRETYNKGSHNLT